MASSIRFDILVTIVTFILFSLGGSQNLTDTLTWGGSDGRSGYEDNHNMDPAIVEGSTFGQLWKTDLPGRYGEVPEQIYAQPLIYTESDGVQYVFIATQQNNVYKLNAKTGQIVASRNLGRVFLTADLDQCNDVAPVIGSTATGVIDASTGTWYLTTKTYSNQDSAGPVGRPNGRYKVFALQTKDLSDRANFPIDLENTPSSNSPDRWFNGGIHHQRPALLMHNDFIYAGFASHCIQYNYTGWIIGWHKGTGRLVESWATMDGATNQVGGAGIWMSGGGIAAAGDSMYFSTGNDFANELADGHAADMQNRPLVMGEAVVNAGIQSNGQIVIKDFFMPEEKQQLDNADRDLGTTPFQLLPSQFSCGNVKRIGMVTGKTGKTYWLNVDDLGGFRQGQYADDRIIQSYQHENSVYAGAGVYPGDGGYVYINVIGYPTRVFKFSCDGGRPYFNPAGQTGESNSGYLGLGHASVTSLNGSDGTGLLWITDPQGENLRIYKAVPDDDTLVKIKTYSGTGASKFGKLAFGDGTVYHGNMVGSVFAYGAPVNQAFDCNTLSFNTTNLNTTLAPLTVQCQAKTTTTVVSINITSQADFVMQQVPDLPLIVQAGSNLSFPVLFKPRDVGPRATAIVIGTAQDAKGFTAETRVQLRGQGRSLTGILKLSPPTLDWNGVITGAEANGVNQSFILSNVGNTQVNISAIRYSTDSSTGPWTASDNSTTSPKISAFTFFNLPSSIAPNTVLTIPVNFNPTRSGAYQVFLRFESSGGTVILKAAASGSEQPKALIEFGTSDGTWQTFNTNGTFAFGNVITGTSRDMQLRITNAGGSQAAPLVITVSKPPLRGRDSYIGARNIYDLAEGTHIAAGQNATAIITCSPPLRPDNSPGDNQTTVWTMNLNDPTFGHSLLTFSCSAVPTQSGPVDSNGQAFYKYAGCFKDNTPGRQMQVNIASTTNMTNGDCINQCSDAGYTFAATEYQMECWCGNFRAKYITDESDCNYRCTGNSNQTCGGSVNGTPRMSLFGDTRKWDGNNTNDVGPYTNPGVNNFTSLGCWSYTPGDPRPVGIQTTSDHTVASCVQACHDKTYMYAGLEFGGECYCGNATSTNAVQADASQCSIACSNNGTEYCGASYLQNLYFYSPPPPSAKSELDPYVSIGCYSDGDDRTLTGQYLADANAMTPVVCKQFCAAQNSTYFGVEYGMECFCGQELGLKATKRPDNECNTPCRGNNTQSCGATYRLNMYQLGDTVVASTTSSTAAISTTTTTSAATSSSALTTTSLPASTSVASSIVTSSDTASSTTPPAITISTGSSSLAISSSTTSMTITTSAVPSVVTSSIGSTIQVTSTETISASVASTTSTSITSISSSTTTSSDAPGSTSISSLSSTSTVLISIPISTSTSLPELTTSSAIVSLPTTAASTSSSVSVTSSTLSSTTTSLITSSMSRASVSETQTTSTTPMDASLSNTSASTLSGTVSSSTVSSQASTGSSSNLPTSSATYSSTASSASLSNVTTSVLTSSSTTTQPALTSTSSLTTSVTVSTFSLILSTTVSGTTTTSTGGSISSSISTSASTVAPIVTSTTLSSTTMTSSQGLSSTTSTSASITATSPLTTASSSLTTRETNSSSTSVAPASPSITTSAVVTTTSPAFPITSTPSSSAAASASTTSTIATSTSIQSIAASISSTSASSSSTRIPTPLFSSPSTTQVSTSTIQSTTTLSPSTTRSPSTASTSSSLVVSSPSVTTQSSMAPAATSPLSTIRSSSSTASTSTTTNIVQTSSSVTSPTLSTSSSTSMSASASTTLAQSTTLPSSSTTSTVVTPVPSSSATLPSTTVSSSSPSTFSSASTASSSTISVGLTSTTLAQSSAPTTSTIRVTTSTVSLSVFSSSSSSPSSIASSQISTSSPLSTTSVQSITSSTSSSAQTTSAVVTSTTSRSSSTSSSTTIVTTSSSTTTRSTTTATSITTTSQTPKPTGPTFEYLGCATDSVRSRGLSAAGYAASDMTPAKCQAFCASRNLPLAAVEYSRECYCGSTLAPPSKIASPNAGCNMPCAGDRTQKCGGADFMNVYRNTNYEPTAPTQTISNYVYQGCYLDRGAPRVVVGRGFTNDQMTEEMCVERCRGAGYIYAGVENGNECFCGSSLAKPTKMPESECATVCPGDPTEFCGGAWRLNLWMAK